MQARLGDPIPLFELVLPRRAAKAAVPILAVVSLVGIMLVVLRWMFDVVPAIAVRTDAERL